MLIFQNTFNQIKISEFHYKLRKNKKVHFLKSVLLLGE